MGMMSVGPLFRPPQANRRTMLNKLIHKAVFAALALAPASAWALTAPPKGTGAIVPGVPEPASAAVFAAGAAIVMVSLRRRRK